MAFNITTAEMVFIITLLGTFGAAILARRHSTNELGGGLSEMKLNRWLVGLSAGTTANSGFIVTGAVGLGYMYGVQWLLLPLAWLLGDIVFWSLFPQRINAVGRKSRATTLSELLTAELDGPMASAAAVLTALVILVCLTGYTSAQWIAGQKFLAGSFGLPSWMALSLFAVLIIGYSAIGGFRGSVYTDTLQAVIRIVGTVIALGAVTFMAMSDPTAFWKNIAATNPAFMNFWPGGVGATLGFIFGFAAAAIGFGLGQPQIVSRYLAGSTPEETQGAWWIYIFFVQFTWIAMTVFGVILRGVMPGIADAETGLSVFTAQNLGALATGIIAADIFATIAATSNGLLIAMAQAVNHDLVPRLSGGTASRVPLSIVTVIIGGFTMAASTLLSGSVYTIALSSVSLMGAGLAPAVIIRAMHWRHSALSLILTIASGITAAVIWKQLGLSGIINETGIGMTAGLVAHASATRFLKRI
jgi:sodium/proline symporter